MPSKSSFIYLTILATAVVAENAIPIRNLHPRFNRISGRQAVQVGSSLCPASEFQCLNIVGCCPNGYYCGSFNGVNGCCPEGTNCNTNSAGGDGTGGENGGNGSGNTATDANGSSPTKTDGNGSSPTGSGSGGAGDNRSPPSNTGSGSAPTGGVGGNGDSKPGVASTSAKSDSSKGGNEGATTQTGSETAGNIVAPPAATTTNSNGNGKSAPTDTNTTGSKGSTTSSAKESSKVGGEGATMTSAPTSITSTKSERVAVTDSMDSSLIIGMTVESQTTSSWLTVPTTESGGNMIIPITGNATSSTIRPPSPTTSSSRNAGAHIQPASLSITLLFTAIVGTTIMLRGTILSGMI
ncbi:hypothetical protein AA313_de0203037 [Arthrobotrys entomopaga]|nr:hypothetical protein AA313_de0203037 [Arthrobotrys entomopaga]